MSRLAGINDNDTVNGEGVCVSVFLQGCPYHCKGCQNPETWDFSGGDVIEDEDTFIEDILNKINKNGIQRNLSILGGEPLCKENYKLTVRILSKAKEKYPTIKTFVWTGATLDALEKMYNIKDILKDVDVLIAGPYIESLRDITLKFRGSKNQVVLLNGIDFL